MEIEDIVRDFGHAMKAIDSRRPQAVNMRTKVPYQPGIGPHPENQTVGLVAAELEIIEPELYKAKVTTNVSYPGTPRQKCDLCIGLASGYEWAVEVKMLRILGDNGKANDNILMHILSPYAAHRSALTDCDKLVASSPGRRSAIIVYGYEADAFPLETAMEALEALARLRVRLGPRHVSVVEDLVHPVHSSSRVYGWELLGRRLDV